MIPFWRLLHIKYVLVKHGVDKVLSESRILRPIRFLRLLFPHLWFQKRPISRGQAIRAALEELGPIFIKFGQALSTRPDFIPEDILIELITLQDNVPPFDSRLARSCIEAELKQPIDTVFDEFNDTPVASASIAQVHGARLKTGQDVVIKVLRPGIEKKIGNDIALLELLAKFADKTWPRIRRFKPQEFVEEFRTTLLDELDLLREAANASQLKRNFQHSPLLYIPNIVWDLTRKKVMIMERLHGVRISDVETLRRENVNFKVLAERAIEIFFTQVFRDCFFHADMHPGNLFVDISDPEKPRYLAVDFGIMGALGPEDQHYLAENFLAFFKRDYRRVAELHVASGWVPPDTRIDAFEASIRTVCEPMFERPLKDISFGQTLMNLFQTARRFNVEIQPQFLLLQKTLLNVEGLGRQLYPDLDLWHTAKPILENWMKQQIGVGAILKQLRHKLPRWLEKMPEAPDALFEMIGYIKQESHHRKQHHHEIPYPQVTVQPNQVAGSLLAITTILAGAGVLILKYPSIITRFGASLGGALMGGGLLLYLWVNRRRS
ncbi:MAG: ubiquinone biosynthesis regulatory protein kinase UbiB [Gammaproteobacteria bacterium]